MPITITEDFLDLNEYSRPGTPLKKITKIIVHYVGNPMSTAKNNRDYFNNQTKFPVDMRRYVSSHYIVGLQGEVIQCIPHNEISYCASAGNAYGINIECCHPDVSGKFSAPTYDALVQLLAQLCKQLGLKAGDDIIRHYDVTGKLCPLWYAKNTADWNKLKSDVAVLLTPSVTPPVVPPITPPTTVPPVVPPTTVPGGEMTVAQAAEKLKKIGITIDTPKFTTFLRSL